MAGAEGPKHVYQEVENVALGLTTTVRLKIKT
jgi:hypothetical protein